MGAAAIPLLTQAAVGAGTALVASALAPKPKKSSLPAQTMTVAENATSSAQASRAELQRNALRRGIYNTIKTGGAGITAMPPIAKPSLKPLLGL
jgi:hypothetical protein